MLTRTFQHTSDFSSRRPNAALTSEKRFHRDGHGGSDIINPPINKRLQSHTSPSVKRGMFYYNDIYHGMLN